ncbi:Amino acid ABC transporter, permease protein, 3-TM domain, His/Glu/Gln/Arg/opine family [Syntrophomonas zehnderi OL-4]|uniref:Amino acid ABC transporter, permease protein, 3-TM domain, His/Glu/Gln/Arg/opine family n=2 Tax=Syntrophomonas TaxID=862 RepID=A0A0E4GAQ0_9FIRM|nr:Amino acid ABC transporter, permease protein, 3-TM domain, His/Glu/Gln/Arg/opine family [Syntrophomonas zehnderi OL-4]
MSHVMPGLFGINFIQTLMEINGLKLITSNLDVLLLGALVTLELTALAVAFGMILGLIFGLAKLSPQRRLIYGIATFYIDFFRGTPLFVQILLLYFGILPMFGHVGDFSAAVIACSLNSGAYIAEIVRAGIQAIDKGQMEAGRSLGMTHGQTMWYIILPQAYKVVIPPLINEFIAMLKDTSLVSLIGVSELTLRGKLLYSVSYNAAWVWGTVAIIYFIMTKLLAMLGDYVERRLATE